METRYKIFMTIATIIMLTYIVILIHNYSDDTTLTNSGIITEKFRGGNNWVTTYHFAINNSFDIDVSETIYYQYSVNDTYAWR